MDMTTENFVATTKTKTRAFCEALDTTNHEAFKILCRIIRVAELMTSKDLGIKTNSFYMDFEKRHSHKFK